MLRNKHFNALLTKFFLIVTVLGLILPAASNVRTSSAVLAAVVLTVVAYLVADLLVLPQYGNRVAVVADGIVTLVMVEVVIQEVEGVQVPFLVLILLALLIGLGEWYYHWYLARLIFKGRIKR